MRIDVIDQIAQNTHNAGGAALLDRAALFGDGFFTTGIIVNHQFCHQALHFQRLENSAKKLRFKQIYFNDLKSQLTQICQQHTQAVIRINIHRQQKQRGYSISPKAIPVCQIIVSTLISEPTSYCQLIDANTNISFNPSLAGIKHLNRLDSVLASSEISSPFQETLMYHQDQVVCGSKTNLFVKYEQTWLTPALDSYGIEGITRGRVIQAFEKQGIKYATTVVHRKKLESVEAAFMTNSLIGVWPVESINGRGLDIKASEKIRCLVNRV